MRKSPAGAAAASSVAREQSHRSSALPGHVSMTTISVLRERLTSRNQLGGCGQVQPLLLSTFFFFFFFCQKAAALPPLPVLLNSKKGNGLPALNEMHQIGRPIIWNSRFSRTLPRIEHRRNRFTDPIACWRHQYSRTAPQGRDGLPAPKRKAVFHLRLQWLGVWGSTPRRSVPLAPYPLKLRRASKSDIGTGGPVCG